jgi:hypothetical protein
LIGCVTAVTVVLFVISLVALERSPGHRSILLSLALGLFSLKNIALTYLYLMDDLPDVHPLMFVDVIVTGFILLRLLIQGTSDRDEERGPPAILPGPISQSEPVSSTAPDDRTSPSAEKPPGEPPEVWSP